MNANGYRQAIADYVLANARPPDKFSHQPRLYRLSRQLAEGRSFDDDVLYAAALPVQLQLASARRVAEKRVAILRAFLESAETERDGADW